MTTLATLKRIEDRLATIETQLTARGALIDVTQALDDNLSAFGLITQLVDIYRTQRDDRQKQADAILDRLTVIEAALTARVPVDEIQQAMQDAVETLSIVGQLKEVEHNQRDQLVLLVGLAAELLKEARVEDRAGADGRRDIQALLVQLREIGRKHVLGLADVVHEMEKQSEA